MTSRRSKPRRLGIIGGSGFYNLQDSAITLMQSHENTETPFGSPSGPILELSIHGTRVFFIARHGPGHRFLPSEVPYRANIYALRNLGVTAVISISAVGILRDGISPGDLITPDQFIDRTVGIRPNTFMGGGIVGHVPMGNPTCPSLRSLLRRQAERVEGRSLHERDTYVCIEGPHFSTRAESLFYRNTLRASVIGMTAMPEAKLAREASLCYALLALATDYDAWRSEEEPVDVATVVASLHRSSGKARETIVQVARALGEEGLSWDCACQNTLQNAIMSDLSKAPAPARTRVDLLLRGDAP